MDLRVQDVIDAMTNDLGRNWSVDELAASVYLSTSRFSQLFRLEMGESPGRYLKRRKMEKARELLETTWMKVKDISTSVGVCDTSHFVREFKKLYGAFPTDYRIRHRRGMVPAKGRE